MTITKETIVDQITVTENGVILYREATRVIEDNVELTKTYHRSSLAPAQNLTDVPDKVAAICNLTWTPEVIEQYQIALAKNLSALEIKE
tara:strand:+ start:454 stop:720 length:267 start_codon:yes stop_codon:yes gene_type:complete